MINRPSKRLWTTLGLTLGLLGSLLAGSTASAITYGQRDDTNQYANVGAMVVKRSDGSNRAICSGALISPTVFLTASHCTAAVTSSNLGQVYVSFDLQITNRSALIKATMQQNPAYNQAQNDTGDIAVLLLEKAVKHITPAELPTQALLDQLHAQHGLKDRKFVAVGYGLNEPVIGGGAPTHTRDNYRRYALSEFNALNETWLRLSQNNATGNGGTCYGDSGGPNFMLHNGRLLLVGVTVTGDYLCLATNVDYRTDTPSARGFLRQFVTLP